MHVNNEACIDLLRILELEKIMKNSDCELVEEFFSLLFFSLSCTFSLIHCSVTQIALFFLILLEFKQTVLVFKNLEK
jgi:hypothetical protein